MTEQQEQKKGEKPKEQDQKQEKKIVIPAKKPKLSKAERRALQEAQRAAKGQSSSGEKQKKEVASSPAPTNTTQTASVTTTATTTTTTTTPSKNETEQNEARENKSLFTHLTPFKDRSYEPHMSGVSLQALHFKKNLHPAVLKLGIQYANGTIRGSNSRCRAMLECFKTVIESFVPVSSNNFRQELYQSIIRPSFQHWTTNCRPHSISMGNAFTFLKRTLQNNMIEDVVSVEEGRELLIQLIDSYISERIVFADTLIAEYASPKLNDGDVILIYGYSETIDVVLEHCIKEDKIQNVILVDSSPFYEAKKHLEKLQEHNISCTYVLYNALSYVIMNQVTKVLLGAAGLMSDGCVLSRIGTAGVALLAHSCSIPVLFCCETYKISYRVQLDSFTENELGDPRIILQHDPNLAYYAPLEEEEKKEHGDNVHLVHLTYDLTSSDFVSGIITEMGILPPTSVAVLLREMNVSQENLSNFQY